MTQNVTTFIKDASASFTRPANVTQYAIGDAITNSTSAPVPFSFTNVVLAESLHFKLTDIIITSNGTSPATLLTCKLWLFSTSPGATNDNSPMSITDAENNACDAVIALTLTSDGTLNSRVEAHDLNINLTQLGATKTIYGLLQATNTYTPLSGEVFTIRIKGIQYV